MQSKNCYRQKLSLVTLLLHTYTQPARQFVAQHRFQKELTTWRQAKEPSAQVNVLCMSSWVHHFQQLWIKCPGRVRSPSFCGVAFSWLFSYVIKQSYVICLFIHCLLCFSCLCSPLPPSAGFELLYQPDVVRLYLSILTESQNFNTLEAAAGALQNLSAGNWTVSAVFSLVSYVSFV